MKKTKIICTIGPTSEDRETLKAMMLAGMNAARLNFSHGSYEEHKKKINLVKELRDDLGLYIPIILDTKGPEIRTGSFGGKDVYLEEGQTFILTSEDIVGDNTRCSITYEKLSSDVKPGDTILIDDGLVGLNVDATQGKEIHCTVKNAGVVKDKKGVNVPGVKVQLPAMTDKDKEDILFGIKNDVDFIAASFTRKAADVMYMREFLRQNGGGDIRIISKIENAEGIENIDEIIDCTDSVMVARGDMGVEVPAEEVPLIQKEIIKKCNVAGKFVVTATQMLDSMMRNPRPTRAEVTDVANAILDGTDVVMLSGETASGKYPVEAVTQMARIAETTEQALNHENIMLQTPEDEEQSITDSIGYATCTSSDDLGAKAILTPTASGYTAAMVAKFRPIAPILGFAYTEKIARQMALIWGIEPFIIPHEKNSTEVFSMCVLKALEKGKIKEGDIIVITAGMPVGLGRTNTMRIHVVGNEF